MTADDNRAESVSSPESAKIPLIIAKNLTKTYMMGKNPVNALRGVSLTLYKGEFVAIMGPSGSGKSTFMNLIGCLDQPTSGSVILNGAETAKMTSDQLAATRSAFIGFVFQGFHLLQRITALRNVELPMVYQGISQKDREQKAQKYLEIVGLGQRAQHRPIELSGGQQQRVAIARALINNPVILLADEPTGNLDSRTSMEIMALFQALNRRGLTIALVTHEPDIAAYAGRHIAFHDGKIIQDEVNTTPRNAAAELQQRIHESQAEKK